MRSCSDEVIVGGTIQEEHRTKQSITHMERGTWEAQSVKHPSSAQVMISWFVSSRPALGSLLSAQSLLLILCPPLSLPLFLSSHTYTHSLSFSLLKITLKTNFFKGPLGGSVG